VCAYGPIGSPGKPNVDKVRGLASASHPQLLQDPVLGNIAKIYNKTPAQILLRFLIQEDVVVIPKSGNPERLKQNFEVFDFELDSTDMKTLRDLDRGARYFEFNWTQEFLDHPEFPFKAPF
jgi:diketogulonate reductase-like aldo/keto reductase